MYSSESLLASDLVCTGTVELKTEATFKYIAFIFDSDGGRVKEFEVYAGKNQDTPFVPENLLQTDLLSKTAVVKNISAGNVYDHSQFNGAGTIDIINDGDTDTKVDAYGANDWGHNSGVLFQLNNSAYCGEVKIYSGYEEYPDTYDVYASADLSSLYEDASRVATGVVCTGTAASVTVNREIKYLAVFLTDYTYNGRIAEIELWSAQKTDSGEQGGDPTPEDPTPEDPTPEDPTPEDPTPEEPAVSNNFISKHRAKGGASGVLGDVANGGFSDGDRFSAAQSDALDVAVDGDTETYFQVWGALDWEYPKNVGARYTLDALYQVDYAYITAGTAETPVTFDVYASDAVGTLFGEGNLVKSGVVCKGDTVKVEVNRLVSCVAFIITKYDLASNTAMISEFDLSGSEKAVEKEVIKWPAVPSGENILKKAVAKEIIAPNGDFSGTKEYDYRFLDMQTESDLSILTDGDSVKHYDIWSLTEKDKPGVLYELDAYYDLTHLHGWAGVFESELLTNFGYKVYAADNAETLFKSKNLVFTHSNSADTTNEFGVNVSLSRIKYIAFIL
ncbi:MAG: hypothetical protein IJU84_01030, partial [Clostridia bacterium]|nr:hypothetical protein [Clostridia bacterium]